MENVDEERPECAAGVVRVPGRALDSHPHDQPDRIDGRDKRVGHRKTKGPGSRVACLAIVFKLLESASTTWGAFNGSTLVADVIAGVQFADGLQRATARSWFINKICGYLIANGERQSN